MSRGEPTDEKLVQDYTSKWYPLRYSGSGFLYHSRIVTEMLDGVRMSDRHSDKILDSGCGNGFVSQLLPNFNVVGIDISDGMLLQNPFKWVKAPVEKIPFEDNHFDWVVSRSLLHHLDDPRIGLKEMYRVLKPGGKFVAWDPNHSFFVNTFRKIFQHTDRFSHLHKSFSDKELIKMLEETGFKVTYIRYIGFLSYPLCAFPDIVNFHIPLGLTKSLIAIDDFIGKTPLKRLAWSIMIKATK